MCVYGVCGNVCLVAVVEDSYLVLECFRHVDVVCLCLVCILWQF